MLCRGLGERPAGGNADPPDKFGEVVGDGGVDGRSLSLVGLLISSHGGGVRVIREERNSGDGTMC